MHEQVPIKRSGPRWVVRYAYYTFLFSIPLEEAATTGYFSIAKLAGFGFMLAAAMHPRVCFRFPPNVFFLLVLYLAAYLVLGIAVATDSTIRYELSELMLSRFITLTQMLVLFWVSYNLLSYEKVARGAWLAVGAGSFCLATLHLSGMSVLDAGQDRLTSFGANPNTIATILSIGTLALAGVAYSNKSSGSKIRLLMWISAGFLAAAIVSTGSRGPMVGLIAGLMTMGLGQKNVKKKVTLGVVAGFIISALVWISYTHEPVRARWERSLGEGNLAGRESILPVAWEMVKEKPLAGWGPVYHYHALGLRLGEGGNREAHNLYLWVLLETGLVGALPFFAALWCCCRSALRARSHGFGILPLALLVAVLLVNMSATGHNRKLFWVVLAYAAASGTYQIVRRPDAQRMLARIRGRPQQIIRSPSSARGFARTFQRTLCVLGILVLPWAT